MARKHWKHKQLRSQSTTVARIERPESGDSEMLQLSDGAIRVAVGDRKAILIDSSKLATPRNVYDADVSWVEHRPGASVSLFFGKLNRDKPEHLKSRIELRYPPEDFVRHFWGNSRDFHAKLRGVAERLPRDEWRDNVNPEKWPAEKDHSEWVNFDYIAFAGTQAAMDLFNLAPGGVARYSRGQGTAGLELHAVVRIQLTIFELVRLLAACGPVVDMIQKYMPAFESLQHEGEPAAEPTQPSRGKS